MADTVDLKSTDHESCEFKSRHQHQLVNATAKWYLFIKIEYGNLTTRRRCRLLQSLDRIVMGQLIKITRKGKGGRTPTPMLNNPVVNI